MSEIKFENLTKEEKQKIADSMYNPVKICNAYLPSKVHNDIIRKANPTWSEQSLKKVGHMMNESCYNKACKIAEEYTFSVEYKESPRRKYYYARCEQLTDVIGGGFTKEQAIEDARNKLIYNFEGHLLRYL